MFPLYHHVNPDVTHIICAWGGGCHLVALGDSGVHRQLDNEPSGVPQDKSGDQIPVDDVPQTANAPATHGTFINQHGATRRVLHFCGYLCRSPARQTQQTETGHP